MTEPLSISRAISAKAEAEPDRPCLTFQGRTVSRRDFDLATNRLARAYAAFGVGRGDLVTIGLPNSIEFYEATVAIWKLGATPQPVSWRLPPSEREAIIALAQPKLVVGTDAESRPGRVVLPSGWLPDPALSDAQLPDAVSPSWKAPTSGGSTGRPKIIKAGKPGTVTRGNLLIDFGDDGCHVVPGPLYHNAPFASSMQGLFRGNHIVILPRFDAVTTLQAIQDHGATFVVMVPTMMLRIMRLDPATRLSFDLSSLKILQHLAAPCPAWLKEAWIEWIGAEKIWELYTGVEAQAVCEIRGDDWLTHRGSVGPVVSGELKIVGPDGETLPPGQVGEIYMRNSERGNASYSYLGAEATSLPGHWETIGDLGSMDEDGYVYLSDRSADMVLVGGSNVYPAEVENALLEHPSVISCAVIGLPDEDMGNRLHGIVQATEPLTAEILTDHLATRLVPYKRPRSFEFVSDPVRDDAGKVRRAALRLERLATNN